MRNVFVCSRDGSKTNLTIKRHIGMTLLYVGDFKEVCTTRIKRNCRLARHHVHQFHCFYHVGLYRSIIMCLEIRDFMGILVDFVVTR